MKNQKNLTGKLRNRIKKSLFFITAFLWPLSLSAYVPSDTWCSDFSVGAEWIYFSPNSESVAYVFSGSGGQGSTFVDTAQVNRFDFFTSGYRVFGAYGLCNNNAFVSASWTDLKVQESAEASGNLGGVFFDLEANFAKDTREFRYSAVEGILGQRLYNNCCLDLVGFAGVHYARLRSDDDLLFNSLGFITNGSTTNHFWGIGPEVGISFEGIITRCFSLQAIATGAILIGKPHAEISSSDSLESFFFQDQQIWRSVPYTDLRIQLNYDFSIGCIRGQIDAGYEALAYFKPFVDFAFDRFASYRNVTMHGPFIGLDLNF